MIAAIAFPAAFIPISRLNPLSSHPHRLCFTSYIPIWKFRREFPRNDGLNHLKRFAYRSIDGDDDDDVGEVSGNFERAVLLFNTGDYYGCHDVLEEIWHDAEEPIRTIVHGVLQCAVGFHHLFNQNHRGAMMEIGEGLCKLRKMNFRSGPFHEFEKEISAVQEFIYQTQLELAACTDDYCLTMDNTRKSYQLLGDFGAGQKLYCLERGSDSVFYIIFRPEGLYESLKPASVKVPALHASNKELQACACD